MSLTDSSNMTSSPLLDLPGEVRNLIYQYTLTAAPLSLYFRNPEETRMSRRPILVLENNGINGKERTNSPPPEPADEDEDKDEAVVEFNQLKFVNRQLYRETVGLELKYNPITFVSRVNVAIEPFLQLKGFLRTLTAPKLSWLNTVILLPCSSNCFGINIAKLEKFLPFISGFCRQNPHVLVKYIFPDFKLNAVLGPIRFIEMGVFLTMAWEGRDLDILLPRHPSRMVFFQDRIHRSVAAFEAHRQAHPNFTIWPSQAEIDEKFVQASKTYFMDGGAVGFDNPLGIMEDMVKLWTQYAKDWVENGI